MQMKWIACVLFWIGVGCVNAGEQIGWRMDGSGVFADANPVTQWGEDKHIIWRTKMPNWSNAQVVMVGGKLFTQSEPNTLLCLDPDSGKILWQQTNRYEDILSKEEMTTLREKVAADVAPHLEKQKALQGEIDKLRQEMRNSENAQSLRGKVRGLRLQMREIQKKINEVDPLELPPTHVDNGFSSALPVSDGQHVYSVYGNGVVSSFDLEGKRKWSIILEKPTHHWGHSAAPVLYKDMLLVHIQDLIALDKDTGKVIWRRNATEGWGTPLVTRIGKESVVITATKGEVFKVEDGSPMGSIGGLQYATPFLKDDTLYLIEKKARALQLPAQMDESVSTKKLWEVRIKGSRHYASSLLHEGLIYAVSREGWLTVLNADDGQMVYEKRLDINGKNRNSIYPSISFAGGHLYIGSLEGITLVLEPGKVYKEVSRNTLEKYRGTPIFHKNRIYLRGMDYLYCIGS